MARSSFSSRAFSRRALADTTGFGQSRGEGCRGRTCLYSRCKRSTCECPWAMAQASYPCGNFSDTSGSTFLRPKRSIDHVFPVCIRTEDQNQASFSPFGPHEISVLIELTLGHLHYHLRDVPPQPNSRPDYVFRTDQLPKEAQRGNVKSTAHMMQVSVSRNT